MPFEETELTLRVAAAHPTVPFVVVAQTVHACAVALALETAAEPSAEAVTEFAERRLAQWLAAVAAQTTPTTRRP